MGARVSFALWLAVATPAFPLAADDDAARPPLGDVACPNYREVMSTAAYPREAAMKGLTEGHVVVRFTIKADGRVTDVHAAEASDAVFAEAAVGVVRQYKCKAQGRDVQVTVPFRYQLR